MSPAPSAPRSRRALLTAAAAAGGALATQALVRPSPVSAADVVLGASNTATALTTIRTTEPTTTAKALLGLVTYAGSGPSTAGVMGQSNATNGNGVFGVALAGPSAKGVYGRSASGFGVYGEATAPSGPAFGVRGVTSSTSGSGVQGYAIATTGTTYGVYGQVASPAGRGVQGTSTAADGTGVFGQSLTGGNARGVWGRSTDGAGVYGEGWFGLRGRSGQGYGVYAQGRYGVWAESSIIAGIGVRGYTTDTVAINQGVWGSASGRGGRGVQADCTSEDGTGLLAAAPVGDGARGVLSLADQGVAVDAQGGTHGVLARGATGVDGEGTGGNGVYGHTTVSGASGVYGETPPSVVSYGVAGRGYYAVWGEASAETGRGVTGLAYGANGTGVHGIASGNATMAGYFDGDVTVTGTLTAPPGFMLQDHPDAPGQRWYRQAPVGSFEQVTVISGNVVTAASGRAVVRIPTIFGRFHKDLRYQLTLIGQRGTAWVVDELNGRGRFTIGTDVPNARVSWQLTGVRSDPAATKRPLRVEAPKPKRQRGRYLQPELFGRPRSEGLIAQGRGAKGPKAPKPPRRSGALRASGGDRIELNPHPKRK
jgi:hypothetical protein